MGGAPAPNVVVKGPQEGSMVTTELHGFTSAFSSLPPALKTTSLFLLSPLALGWPGCTYLCCNPFLSPNKPSLLTGFLLSFLFSQRMHHPI